MMRFVILCAVAFVAMSGPPVATPSQAFGGGAMPDDAIVQLDERPKPKPKPKGCGSTRGICR